MKIALLSVVALLAAAPAWADAERQLGATVNSNIVAQTIDMDPHYAGVLTEGGSGRRSADAVVRYKLGKLKPLLRADTRTEVGRQGGAGDTNSDAITILDPK